MRTVMNKFTVRGGLRQSAREQNRTVKARVERTDVVYIIILYLYTAKDIIPACAAFALKAVEITVAQFRHIDNGLIGTYERGRHLQIDNPVVSRQIETHNGSRMAGLRLKVLRLFNAITDGTDIIERSV